MVEASLWRQSRTRAAVLAAVTLLGLGSASSLGTAAPNPDPPPAPPPAPTPAPPPPPVYQPPPPPSYVAPPPPPAYTPPPKPVKKHRVERSAEKPIVKLRSPAPSAKGRGAAKPAFAVGRAPQSAGRNRALAASGLAAGDTTSRVLPLLVGAALAFAVLALLPLILPAMLPRHLAVLVDGRRESLIVGAGACMVAIALGLLIASMGS
jgi:hypothetical protein